MSLMKMNILIFVFLLISYVNGSPRKTRMPLLSHLRAPLIAELDVTDINEQLTEFIETQVTEEVNQTVAQNIDETIKLEMLEVKKLFKDETLELKDKMVRDQKDLESTMVLNYTDEVKKIKDNYESEFVSFNKQSESRFARLEHNSRKEINKMIREQKDRESTMVVNYTNEINRIKDNYESEFANFIKRSESRFDKLEQNSRKEINKMKAVITELQTKQNDISRFDCADKTYNDSGVYRILKGFKVYCDMNTDGGGWTVFQRRINGKTDFYRGWEEYKNGFGDLQTEFWLGNEQLYILTSRGKYELRVDLEDFDGRKAYAKYSSFVVENEASKYKLAVSGYSGNAGDSLKYHNKFTTKDQDNDSFSNNCAVHRKGAWWYGFCGYSSLNGVYLGNKIDYTGITWYHWKSNWQSMKTTTMMIRRTD